MKTTAKNPSVLFLIERGWASARELAMSLARQHVECHLVIKGAVPADVLEIITPRAGLTISAIPRRCFNVLIIFKILGMHLASALKCVVVSKEKTLRWVAPWARLWGCTTVLLSERGDSFELANFQQQTISPQQLVEHLRGNN